MSLRSSDALESFSPGRRAVAATILGCLETWGPLSEVDIAARLGHSPAAWVYEHFPVTSALEGLLERGMVSLENGRFHVADPARKEAA